jgi:eukaryotic-like serine/threonine-protein kinase
MSASSQDELLPEDLGEGVTDDLRKARPVLDRVAMDEVRARAQHRLFGSSQPARLGRFVLLKSVAGGGMGVIHRAFDPQLERPVALKLVHPRLHGTQIARARLLAEARVLARLSHPNIVPVYEVLEIDDHVVMVMEMVEGKTLAEWEREKPRTWQEIIQVYVQAGRGLAAAHSLGIIHRDFKPANTIVGDDGRVRVLDFGLAKFSAGGAADPSPSDPNTSLQVARTSPAVVATALHPALTETGELLGTIAYMSPEQLAGEPATPASDQFSFCVALFHALDREPPFTGRDAGELLASMRAQQRPLPRNAKPAWLRSALVRGLAYSPDERHPSLVSLLEQLSRERRLWRWGAGITASGTLVAAIASTLLLPSKRDPLAACDGGTEEIGRVWNLTQQNSLHDVLARINTPYANTVEQPLAAALSSYGARWSAVHRAACREHRRGALPEARFERRMQCLNERLAEMNTAIAVLHLTDASNIGHAPDVAARLSPVEPCTELDAFPRNEAPPPNEQTRTQTEFVLAKAREATALAHAGLSEPALQAAEQAANAAERISYAPAIIEAALTKGSILVIQYSFSEAVAPLRRAQDLALAHGDVRSAVIAGARRLYAEGISGSNLDLLTGAEAVIEPLSRGLQSDHMARPLLLNYIGVLRMIRGDRDSALSYFMEARNALIGIEHPDLELNAVYMNLAMLMTGRIERESTAEHAWARYRDELGPQHTTTLAEQCRYAQYVADPATALGIATTATELYRRYHPTQLRERAECVTHQAFLATELNHIEAAQRLYAEVEGLAEPASNDEIKMRSLLASGYHLLYEGAPKESADRFKRVIRFYEKTSNWWEHLLLGDALLGAGVSEEAMGDDLAASEHLAAAVETLAGAATHNEDMLPRRRLALARYHLAAILQRRGHSVRARELRALSDRFYRETSATAYRHRLDQNALP